MNPKDYTGKEWDDLLRGLSPRQMKNGMKRAYRREANKACKIAVGRLRASGLDVKGNTADWEKSIRAYIYPSGGGFLVTVKARGGRNGKGEKGMHANRFGVKKPVLMFAEEGTKPRVTKTKSRYGIFRRRKGHSTGQMPAYGFLEQATPAMYRSVETGIFPEVERATSKVAKKAGMI